MTDVIKLPGTEMEVIEKYPLSRRLDHPNFGDVCKTTYVVGTITDFEKVSDDPIQVNPRVKVEVDGQESDYIPLFYHPKTQYWDGTDVLATDFDEETGAFKQAWMSFRVDDEVAVMLKEGVPVAVMGFADGVPRVGEDVVKATPPAEDWVNLLPIFQLSNRTKYPDGEIGPDGLNLGLVQKAESNEGGEETEEITHYINSYSQSTWQHACSYGFGPFGFGDTVYYEGETPGESYNYCLAFGELDAPSGEWHHLDDVKSTIEFYYILYSKAICKLSLWIIKVGPILYAIYGLSTKRSGSTTYMMYVDWTSYNSAVNDWVANQAQDEYKVPPPIVGELEPIGSPPGSGDNPVQWADDDFSINRVIVKAGIYSEDLLQRVKDSISSSPLDAYNSVADDWLPDVEGLTLQTDLSTLLLEDMAGGYFDPQPTPEDFEWFTRPHTKAELQAANMWPAA